MPQKIAASPDAIDLSQVTRSVVRRLPLLAVLAGLAGAATAGVLSTMAPQYLSQVQLKIRGGSANDTSGAPDKEAVGTHVRGLMSTELALKMGKALSLTQRPEFNAALLPDDLYGRTLRSFGLGGPKAGETDEDRMLQAYFKAVRAYQVRETRAIIVDCTSSNAKFSATCANTLASLYRDSLRGRAVVENSDVRSKLGPEVERLTRETTEAEAQAAEFRGKANLFQGTAQSSQLKDQQLADLSAELTRASTVRGEAEARAQAARDMSARGTAAANPDVQRSTLIPRMEEQRVTLERQISELSATLLPGHPRMKQLYSELSGLQSQIRAEVLKVVDSLGNDAKIAADREASVRRRVDEMKKTVVSSAPDTARLAQLEAQAKAKRTELERVQRQFEVAASTASAAVTPAEVEIVSEAYPSNEKVFPKIGSMAGLASFATFIVALLLSALREMARGARTAAASAAAPQPIEPKLAPFAPSETAAVSTKAATLRSAHVKPTIEAAAQHLLDTANGNRGYRVLMSGAGHAAGVAEASSLAQHLAKGGAKTLLVAWAGAGDALARWNGATSQPGTAELLKGAASLEEAIQPVADGSFDLLAAGASMPKHADSDSAALVLDALDESYDMIVVHGPQTIARDLFEALQGRFDTGLLLEVDATELQPANANTAFLGFNVPDLPVLTVIPQAVSPKTTAAAGPKTRLRATRAQPGA